VCEDLKKPETNGGMVLFAKAITPNPGGIETYSNHVALAWAESGFRVTVISQFHGDVGTSRRGKVTVINVGPGSQLLVFLRMWQAALRLRADFIPQLIHATTWRVAVPALLVYGSVPIAVTIHGREVTQMKGWKSWLMRRVFARVNKPIVVSKTTFTQCFPLVPSLEKKAVISWNGISYMEEAKANGKRWAENPQRFCRLYTLCRLAPRKNIAGALRALSLLRFRGVENWDYFIAGDGEDKSVLENLTRELNLADKVRFLGRVNDADIPDLYRAADVFVHPQTAGSDGRDIEGFGIVLADAMSFGVPVVAGREGAPREFIRDGETGFLVDGHDILSLSSVLERLITNQAERRRVGENSRVWALSNLSWRNHVLRIVDTMQDSGLFIDD
jgi:phosphatidyl-myo-inositol dimannoside synthase